MESFLFPNDENGLFLGKYKFEEIESFVNDSIVPSICKYECSIEPDGYCEHGQPSVLIKLGLI